MVWGEKTHSSLSRTKGGRSEYFALRFSIRSMAASLVFKTTTGVRKNFANTTSPTGVLIVSDRKQGGRVQSIIPNCLPHSASFRCWYSIGSWWTLPRRGTAAGPGG